MKILIDEQLPIKLKYRFAEKGYEVYSVKDMNWLGIKNGQLLYQMQLSEFDILITNDKNMYYQQRIAGYNLSLAERKYSFQ